MNLEELIASTPPMQQHALIKGFQAGAASRDADIHRLQMALADTEALELGTSEKCDQLREQVAMLREALRDCAYDEDGFCINPDAAEALAATGPKP